MLMTRKRSAYSIFLHLALIFLSIQILLLIRENRELRSSLGADQLAAGDVVKAFPVLAFDGGEETLAFRDEHRESLLFVFTAKCPVCVDNLGSWIGLYERYRQNYRVVGVAIAGLEEAQAYADDNALPYRVVVPVGAESFADRYEIRGVPTTIRVGTDGLVKNVWLGLLPEDLSLS